jgi:SOS response regulatory protein OraA/RecX
LRRARPGAVLIEVDGEPWRAVPDDVIVRCGLAAGVELERPLLRRLRAELRTAEALALAGDTLRRRDVSQHRLSERLRRAGIAPAVEANVLATLVDTGAVDDARLAAARARSLAERGWGDLAIAARLDGERISEPEARAAIAELEPEMKRASRLAAGAGDHRKAWRLLSRRGFDPETVESVLGVLDERDRRGLG